MITLMLKCRCLLECTKGGLPGIELLGMKLQSKFLGKFLLFILTSSVLGLQVDAEILDKFPKYGKDEVF